MASSVVPTWVRERMIYLTLPTFSKPLSSIASWRTEEEHGERERKYKKPFDGHRILDLGSSSTRNIQPSQRLLKHDIKSNIQSVFTRLVQNPINESRFPRFDSHDIH